MPRRYVRKKSKRKTAPRALVRYRRRRMPLTATYIPSGLPVIRRAKLRYAQSFQLTSTSGSLSNQQFRATSLFDPDFTGVGHQPMGFDQWAALFNHYVVLGARITCIWTNNSAATNPLVVGVYTSDDPTIPYTNTDALIEARKGYLKPFTADPSTSLKMSYKFSTKKFFNLSDVRDNTATHGADVTTNPSENAYFNVVAQARNAGTEAVNLQVIIDYIAEFSEPQDIAQS